MSSSSSSQEESAHERQQAPQQPTDRITQLKQYVVNLYQTYVAPQLKYDLGKVAFGAGVLGIGGIATWLYTKYNPQASFNFFGSR